MTSIDWPGILILLFLLGTANFLPILARTVLGDHFALPVDLGRLKWFDGRDLFGPHKTWRGLAFSTLGTAAAASLTPFGAAIGTKIALLSLSGDLISSFIKRRFRLRSGAFAPGLDQGVEAVLPLWAFKEDLAITWAEICIVTALFAICELAVSPILYRLGIRRNPH